MPPILVSSLNGTPMHPDVLSNATLMIAGGEDILTVSRRLGHAQASTTANIYGHAIQAANAKAAETLQNILKPLSKKA